VAIWPEASGGGAAPAWDADGLDQAAGWPAGSSFTPSRHRSGRRRGSPGGWRSRLALLGLMAGLAGLAVSVAGVVVQILPRNFTTAQQHQITAWQIGGRWRAWPAGRIFPSTIRYQVPASALTSPTSLPLAAHRAGIAPQATCRTATDRAIAQILAAHGCLAVLRATYSDATGSMALTVGVVVFGDAAAEAAAVRALPGALPDGSAFAPGVRPVRFRGTAAARFGPAQRQLAWAASNGPYLVMAAAGYADGRPRVRESANPYARAEMRSLARGVAGFVGSGLAAAPPPPHCPGAPGC
jgi:hypothetical protein